MFQKTVKYMQVKDELVDVNIPDRRRREGYRVEKQVKTLSREVEVEVSEEHQKIIKAKVFLYFIILLGNIFCNYIIWF